MAYGIDKLRPLYLKYDSLAASGEDVVADLRKEINNLELAYLKDHVFPQVAQFMASKIKDLRCCIDSSFQFDGKQGINYSFCSSGSMIFVKDSIDINSVAGIPQPVITQSLVEQPAIINPTPTTSALQNKNIRVENYSEKAVAVYGDTRDFFEEMKNLGGYFNPRLRGGAGWVVSKKRLSELKIIFAPYLHSQNSPFTHDKEPETNLFMQADTNIEYGLTEDQWIKRILSMKCMPHKGMVAPHKAVFMLAVIDAIKRGYIREKRIFATTTLSNCFVRIWKKYIPSEWPFRANAFQPYIHMSGESFYFLVKAEGIKSFDVNQNWTRTSVVRYVEYAYFDNHLFELLHKQEFTDRLSKQLIDKFFSQQISQSVAIKKGNQALNINTFAGYKQYLSTLTSNKGRSYTVSSINVYATALRSKYMQDKVSKFAHGEDLETISDLSIIDKILNEVKYDSEHDEINRTSYIALKMFRDYRRLNSQTFRPTSVYATKPKSNTELVSEGKRIKIRVTFPDGRIICPSKVLEALLEVVKYAGADRVRELKINNCGDNLIIKNPTTQYMRPSKPVGNGWFCNTCSNTETKFIQIAEISNRLDLGLKVEMVEY